MVSHQVLSQRVHTHVLQLLRSLQPELADSVSFGDLDHAGRLQMQLTGGGRYRGEQFVQKHDDLNSGGLDLNPISQKRDLHDEKSPKVVFIFRTLALQRGNDANAEGANCSVAEATAKQRNGAIAECV